MVFILYFYHVFIYYYIFNLCITCFDLTLYIIYLHHDRFFINVLVFSSWLYVPFFTFCYFILTSILSCKAHCNCFEKCNTNTVIIVIIIIIQYVYIHSIFPTQWQQCSFTNLQYTNQHETHLVGWFGISSLLWGNSEDMSECYSSTKNARLMMVVY